MKETSQILKELLEAVAKNAEVVEEIKIKIKPSKLIEKEKKKQNKK